MRRVIIVLVALVLVGLYLIWRKENHKDERPFKAEVMAVYAKLDGSGYAVVLKSAIDPKVWVSAETTEMVRIGDIATVDRANGTIYYNVNKEGKIVKRNSVEYRR